MKNYLSYDDDKGKFCYFRMICTGLLFTIKVFIFCTF